MIVLNSSNTRIRVTAEVLISRANDAEQKINSMDSRLQNIQRIVSATRHYWVGEAGDACRRRYENEQQEIRELMKRLKGQPKTLLKIANIYRETEEAATDISSPLPENVIE